MAFSYMHYDRDQPILLPPDVREWLPEDHLAWLVLDAVAQIDTSAFHARHRNAGAGRPAYDPQVLLALLVYSYCIGVRSARQIERACRVDVAYRVICVNRIPDHATIARLGADHETAIAGLFTDVLELCAEAGLCKVGVIAIDGTKMAANASLRANRTRAQIRADIAAEVDRILGQAAAADAAEHRLLGEQRGDELPAQLAERSQRLARLSAAARRLDAKAAADTAADQAAADQRAAKQAAAAAEGRKIGGRRPKGAAGVAAAQADLEAARAEAVQRKAEREAEERSAASQGRKLKGRAPDFDRPVRAAEQRLAAAQTAAAERAAKARPDQANITDPDSRVMKRSIGEGWMQAYNAQDAVNENQIVLAAEVTQDAFDVDQLLPMIAATEHQLDAAGVDEPLGTVLVDAG